MYDHPDTWDGGVAFLFDAGYGSRFDGETFRGCFCDGCIHEMLNIGRIRNTAPFGGSISETVHRDNPNL